MKAFILALLLPFTCSAAQTLIDVGVSGSWGITLRGNLDVNSRFGSSVAILQDFNGDGIADIAVGAADFNTAKTTGAREGAIFVINGGANLSALNNAIADSLPTSSSFRLDGGIPANPIDGIANLCDTNGDGKSDIAMTATGHLYVILGNTDYAKMDALNVNNLNPTGVWPLSSGYHVTSPANLASGIAGVGNVAGDAYDEFVVGASTALTSSAGQAYVIIGKTADFKNFALSSATAATTSLNLDGTAYSQAGGSVGGDFDADGDGRKDILIGAPSAFPQYLPGRAFLVYGVPDDGQPLGMLTGVNGATFQEAQMYSKFGAVVTGIGDFNGDGYGDFAIGAPDANPNGRTKAGSVYVIFGNGNRMAIEAVAIGNLDGTTGFRLDGPALTSGQFEQKAMSLSTAGDFNHDGFKDLIVGLPNVVRGNIGGAAYIVFGGPTAGAALNGLALDALPVGIVINRATGQDAGDRLGQSVAGGGDVNHDGYDDVIVGAPSADTVAPGFYNDGQAYVIFGRP